MENTHRLANGLFSLVIAAALIACGGGGGGEGSGANAGASTGGVGGGSANATEINPGLTGKLWFKDPAETDFFVANASTGETNTAFYRRASAQKVFASPDGKLLAMTLYDSTEPPTTRIELYDATKPVVMGKSVYDNEKDQFLGLVTSIQFSSDNRFAAISYRPETASRDHGVQIFDLSNPAAPKVIKRYPLVSSDSKTTPYIVHFDWLPDGSYMYALLDGRLFKGLVTASLDTQMGAIKPPRAELSVRAPETAASPDGKQLAMTFEWKDGPTTKTDVWVGNIDGSNPQQVTKDDFVVSPSWSPNGNHLVVTTDLGSMCLTAPGLGTCVGSCFRWYVSPTARNATPQSSRYVQYVKGYKQSVTCHEAPFMSQ